ncbi:hypothetical protein [Cupriavidus necator]
MEGFPHRPREDPQGGLCDDDRPDQSEHVSLSVPVFSDGKVQGSLLLLTVNTTEEKSSADRLAGELTQLAARIEKLMSEDASLE